MKFKIFLELKKHIDTQWRSLSVVQRFKNNRFILAICGILASFQFFLLESSFQKFWKVYLEEVINTQFNLGLMGVLLGIFLLFLYFSSRYYKSIAKQCWSDLNDR